MVAELADASAAGAMAMDKLWIFETETVQQMLREARHVHAAQLGRRGGEDTRREIEPVILALEVELTGRNANI